MTVEQLAEIVDELIEAMHVQNKELDRVLVELDQVTPHRSVSPEFSVTTSELVALRKRLQKLRGQPES